MQRGRPTAYPIIHKHLALLLALGLLDAHRRDLVQLGDAKLLLRVHALLALLQDVGDVGAALDSPPWLGSLGLVLLRLDDAVVLGPVLGRLAALDAAAVGGMLVFYRPRRAHCE